MTYAVIAQRARLAAAWCFPLLGLAIPVSTALDGMLLWLIVLAWLIALPRAWPEWRATLRIPGIAIAAALFALIAIGTLYGEASAREAWKIAGKYSDFVLMSVLLWAAAAMRGRDRALVLFLVAIVANLVVSYSVANGLVDRIPGLVSKAEYPVGFKLSVTHGIFVAFGAYVFLLLARDAKTTAARAPLIGLALVCAHNVLVIVIGRTGYLVLTVLFGYFVLTALPTWKTRVAALGAIAALFAGVYAVSANLQERVGEALADVVQWKPGAHDRTSVGQRLEYARVSARIVAEHPLTGVGTGGFAAAYAKASDSALVTTNPHNDYLMLGAQVGLTGVALLLALYVSLWRDAARLASRFDRDLLRGIVLTMAIAGLFNSVALDHAEGLLFAWMVAYAYARSGASRSA